ncbi:Hsp20/alpha crystallin family protein [Paraburkholderia terrae]|uniref:Hsp20/alpha crystallin family protein n=1 Tax=Paraburkholderia terrae TaxID=311230 RepID=UPI001EE16CE9|nr:Hsp20/alpha crystallin family protein [Paraburkholderia terrae]GJH02832.1 Hsp20 family protein [Paraburkholderia terrae]
MNDTTEVTQRDRSGLVRRDGEQSTRSMPITPAVDIFEDGQAVTLWADLPGVTRDKLDVRVHDGNLSIEAEAVVPTPANLRLQHAEVREPRFARTFTLAPDFDTSKIEASLQDGVLKLMIPRREEARPRRIEIKAG